MIACEILDEAGKAHFTGESSLVEQAAREQGYPVRQVELSGHCIPMTANEFIHWSSPGLLRGGPVQVNGQAPDKAKVATTAENAQFTRRLMAGR